MEAEQRQPSAEQAEKEKFEILETIVKNCRGTVKWYSHKLLYGFISREDNSEDVFVHRSAIAKCDLRSPNLRNGEPVEFSVVRTHNGVEAYDVTGPNGAPVEGFLLVRRRRRGPKPVGTENEENADSAVDKKQNGVDGDRPPRRRNRRRGGGNQNGEPNGNHSENEVFYEAENTSPIAGQPRVNRAKGDGHASGDFKPRGRGGARGATRGGFRGNFRRGFGGRGGLRGGKREAGPTVETA